MREAALTTVFLGLSGIALALILLDHPFWTIWPIVLSLPVLGALMGKKKDGKGTDKAGTADRGTQG